jgi:hypothetical protein
MTLISILFKLLIFNDLTSISLIRRAFIADGYTLNPERSRSERERLGSGRKRLPSGRERLRCQREISPCLP